MTIQWDMINVYDFFTLDGYNLHCTKDFDPKAKAHKDYSTKLMCKMMDKWTILPLLTYFARCIKRE